MSVPHSQYTGTFTKVLSPEQNLKWSAKNQNIFQIICFNHALFFLKLGMSTESIIFT